MMTETDRLEVDGKSEGVIAKDAAREQRLVDYLVADLKEQERAKNMTNQELVFQILTTIEFTGADILIEEACSRLDPEWATRGFIG
jgi:hypothetical protein